MLLTVICKDQNARDLSWLLRKRPERFQSFHLPFGAAYVFFPRYLPDLASVCLLLEVEGEKLNELYKARDGEFQYVNPRRFLSGSLLSSAIAKVFSSALSGERGERPELAAREYNLEARIANFSCRLKPEYIEKIFSPLGYDVRTEPVGTDIYDNISGVYNLTLTGRTTLQNLLSQLFILLPVFDGQIHFWIGESRLEKFIRLGQNWLPDHPEKRLIIGEYFWPAPALKKDALTFFGATSDESGREPNLNSVRLEKITELLLAQGAKSVVDLGCGTGALLARLAAEKKFTKLAGLDISAKNIESARKKLASPGKPLREEDLFVGSLTYPDKRIAGYDAAVLCEVIEHFEPERMDLVMTNILGYARPKLLVVTTPNKTYNPVYNLGASETRHPDHRHEFDEAEFLSFCANFSAKFAYRFEFFAIGDREPEIGAPTLGGIFSNEN